MTDLTRPPSAYNELGSELRTDIDHLTAAGHNCATVLDDVLASIVNLTARLERLEPDD